MQLLNSEYKFAIKLNGLIGIFLSLGISTSNVNIAREGDKVGKAAAVKSGNVIRN